MQLSQRFSRSLFFLLLATGYPACKTKQEAAVKDPFRTRIKPAVREKVDSFFGASLHQSLNIYDVFVKSKPLTNEIDKHHTCLV
ncbi:hypothetical protein [Niabella beijingensis]|uniref:hypothetical protein n=1 Tax=Niabella beijingensis TaxID=2872700 RepID=UPI001CBB1062|nr:hypothetical protein [Niabella beijingensis]MBZ4190272.1 hypothetical protein [Niabella beijingensis]